MSEYRAKVLRDKMKAKARSLAKPGDYAKDQEVSSADWSPAAPVNADVKTGMRPVSRRAYKKGGKVVGDKATARSDRPARKASGGEIADAIVNRNVKEANAKREGAGKHIGGMKKGGKIHRATGGNIPSAAETEDTKARLGSMQIKPVRGKAENYKKGGKIHKEGGGSLPSPDEAIGSEVRMKGLKVMPSRSDSPAAMVTPAQLRREEGYAKADMMAKRPGRAEGGKTKWIQSAIKKPGALHKQLGVPEGEKIPAKKLAKAAEKGGKLGKRARLAETLKRLGKATGGGLLDIGSMKKGHKSSKKGGKTDINIVIATGKPAGPAADVMAPPPAAPIPMPMPVPVAAPAAMGAGAPPPAMPPMPPGRKAGGRITKVARSYKDIEAGAGSGEGRLQKTDIAKLHHDAPSRKTGGRISKVAKSYKDMTAGAGSGEGRLQKEDIAKAKTARRA